jgi:hypothetical protein
MNDDESYAWTILAMCCWGNKDAMEALGIVRELYFGRWITIEELKTQIRRMADGSDNSV